MHAPMAALSASIHAMSCLVKYVGVPNSASRAGFCAGSSHMVSKVAYAARMASAHSVEMSATICASKAVKLHGAVRRDWGALP